MKVNLFGSGFVGSEFARQNPDTIVNDRNDLTPKSDTILYTISTIDNYNVFTNPYLDIETNLTTLVRVLENARHLGNFTFNFVSSWFVYGKISPPASEETPCNPTGFYSVTKRAAEQLLISYCETFKANYRILRLPNVLGVTDGKVSKKKNAIQYMIRELANGRDVNLYNGNPQRDFMDVRDVARAIKTVLEKGELNSVYNIGNGVGWSIGQLLNDARSVLSTPGNINGMEVPEFHKTVQAEVMYMDVSKLRSLGFKSLYKIPDTIKEIARHYES